MSAVGTKRRKVRKGTRSCWECKRRKIKCVYESREAAVCVGCEQRRCLCVSQELPEDLSPATYGSRHLSERVSRVEDLLNDIVAGQHSQSSLAEATKVYRTDHSRKSPHQALSTPTETLEVSPESPSPCETEPEPDSVTLHHLWAAFPDDKATRSLLPEISKVTQYYALINTQPRRAVVLETFEPPYRVSDLPDREVHPVLLAKYMLEIAIALQSPGAADLLGQVQESPRVLSHRLVTAATTWVTTKEEMQGSVESLICIMLEGAYKMNCGNLRQAWAVYRRAMSVAQMMGLHRNPVPPLRRIDRGIAADPEFMWFRIVYTDRYLSLLLGLPQGTSNKHIGISSSLRDENSLERFERQLAIVASCILERNEGPFDPGDITTAQSIDSKLLSVSNSVPASFWRPVDFQSITPGSPENLLESMRLAAHVYYYGLLIHLHLPYMARELDSGGLYDYSRSTCINASREILLRFIAHRTFRPVSFCARPVDFFAFLAAMTLLLAHLNAHNQTRHGLHTNSLAHQRLSDRAMLEQVLERMGVINNIARDAMAQESARLIRRLLEVEADAAAGSQFAAMNISGDDKQAEQLQEGEVLRLNVPYLGIVKIAPRGFVSRDQLSPWESGPRLQDQTGPAGQSQPGPFGQDELMFQPLSEISDVAASMDDWALQGVDMAFFDGFMRGMS